MSAKVVFTSEDTEKRKHPERMERKFYVHPTKVGMAFGLLHQVCRRDEAYYSEQINSLYFDTPGLEQHEISTSGDFRKDKVRIRWYGKENSDDGMINVFVECKTRQGFAGTKQRCRLEVPSVNLSVNNISKGIVPREILLNTLAGFNYYPSDILMPVILISYWRYRFTEPVTGQRISLDCHITSTVVKPSPRSIEKYIELPGAVIEIKGTSLALPTTLMKMNMLDTEWTRFSKYSASLDAHSEKCGTVGRLSPTGLVV